MKDDSYYEAAATVQIEYDMAVHNFGVDSNEAKRAEKAALDFFNPRRPKEYTSEEAFRRDQI